MTNNYNICKGSQTSGIAIWLMFLQIPFDEWLSWESNINPLDDALSDTDRYDIYFIFFFKLILKSLSFIFRTVCLVSNRHWKKVATQPKTSNNHIYYRFIYYEWAVEELFFYQHTDEGGCGGSYRTACSMVAREIVNSDLRYNIICWSNSSIK